MALKEFILTSPDIKNKDRYNKAISLIDIPKTVCVDRGVKIFYQNGVLKKYKISRPIPFTSDKSIANCIGAARAFMSGKKK